jgi:hypothetical protein
LSGLCATAPIQPKTLATCSFGGFQTVPEPITFALPIFGGLVLSVGLARRFISRRAFINTALFLQGNCQLSF